MLSIPTNMEPMMPATTTPKPKVRAGTMIASGRSMGS